MKIDTGKIATAVIIFIVTGAISTGTIAVVRTITNREKIVSLEKTVKYIRKDQVNNRKIMIKMALKMKAVEETDDIVLGAEALEEQQP